MRAVVDRINCRGFIAAITDINDRGACDRYGADFDQFRCRIEPRRIVASAVDVGVEMRLATANDTQTAVMNRCGCETFRTTPVMYKRTIRITDKGEWRRCNRVAAAEHRFKLWQSAEFVSYVSVLVRSGNNSLRLCGCLFSKFIDMLK